MSGASIFLSATQHFHYEHDRRHEGDWKVKTDGYAYQLTLAEDLSEELLLWHWHPEMRPDTHLHVGFAPKKISGLAKAHIPTGRVAFEQVVRFLVTELDVASVREDWKEVLEDSERRFREFRTWT